MNLHKSIKIIECPRDAMQGYSKIFTTNEKVNYINSLVKCGFDILDMGSFVSPKAVPQMADTKEVLEQIESDDNSKDNLLVIVANKRGAIEAIKNPKVKFIGYPFSISETFQMRNTNSTIEQTYENLKEIQDLIVGSSKELNVYISMGFGNNYGDNWNIDLVLEWMSKIKELDVTNFAVADTIGKAFDETINDVAKSVTKHFPTLDIGFHLHTSLDLAYYKIDAAIDGGITKFDTAIKGFGGCPFAEDKLVGNLATEILLSYCKQKGIHHNINLAAFENSLQIAEKLFH